MKRFVAGMLVSLVALGGVTAGVVGAWATGAIGDWLNEPARLVTIAALAGYHMFEQLDDAIVATVSERDFIDALVSTLPIRRPPGVAEGELEPR